MGPNSLVFVLGINAIIFVLLVLSVIFLFKKQQTNQNTLEEQTEHRFENLFKGLASDVLKQNTESLLEIAQLKLSEVAQKQKSELEIQKKEVEALVKPLAESLKEFKKEVDESEDKRHKEFGSLDRMLKVLAETQASLRVETQNLAAALKRPGVQGRWGELQLKRVVELAGMIAHCDFTEQNSVLNADEARLRPDMVIQLPNNRTIVVDAKAVLVGYLDAEAATTDESRKAALIKHALSLRTRIQELSRKNYWEQFSSTPEFVVLFIPGEAFFSAALQQEPNLVEYAFEQKVVLATPSTLMALLKAVAYGWRQEQLTENAKRISDEAAKIYQGLAVWSSHLEGIGNHLDKATKSYNSAVGSLERTVMPPLRRLKDYGVSAKTEVSELSPLETAIRPLVKGALENEP